MTAAPIVTWGQPLALFLVAAILGGHRAGHLADRARASPAAAAPHQAVNRLVLARACAYVGVLVAGGYLGYAAQLGRRLGRAGRAARRTLPHRGPRRRQRGGHGAAAGASVSRQERRGRRLAWPHVFPQGSSSAAQYPHHRRCRPCHHRGGRRPRRRPGWFVGSPRGRRRPRRRARRARRPDHPLRADAGPSRGQPRPGRAGSGLPRPHGRACRRARGVRRRHGAADDRTPDHHRRARGRPDLGPAPGCRGDPQAQRRGQARRPRRGRGRVAGPPARRRRDPRRRGDPARRRARGRDRRRQGRAGRRPRRARRLGSHRSVG